MPTVTKEPGSAPIKWWTDGVPVEPEARDQLARIAAMPFVHRHVAVMPDVHVGKGATVGSVIATKGAVIPAAVGVDLGCGMTAVRTDLSASDLPDSLADLRAGIEAAIPHGRTDNGGPNDRGAWGEVPRRVNEAWSSIVLGYGFMREAHPQIATRQHPTRQLGTLGTGNHFVEVCLDEADRVWVMLHSGSRGVGNRIGTYFIEKAKEEMRRWFVNLPDRDLAYLPEGSQYFDAYRAAVLWAQSYASINRELMMNAALGALGALGVRTRPFVLDGAVVSCHHNYLSEEKHFGEDVLVTRKGAVSARAGEYGIIPGAMGRQSYIVRGRGNRDSFHSCSHGAGRAMSRTEAKRRFTVEDHAAATAGLECRKDADVVDETPGAYKDIEKVMAAQSDLVEVVHTLRAVLCVKG